MLNCWATQASPWHVFLRLFITGYYWTIILISQIEIWQQRLKSNKTISISLQFTVIESAFYFRGFPPGLFSINKKVSSSQTVQCPERSFSLHTHARTHLHWPQILSHLSILLSNPNAAIMADNSGMVLWSHTYILLLGLTSFVLSSSNFFFTFLPLKTIF